MAAPLLRVLTLLVAGTAAYPSSPYWMNGGRSPFAIPQSMAMPPQFFPNRALSFSGYFTGSGTPYRGQWADTRQNVPYYINEDGSMQVATVMNDFEASHQYNQADSPISMDGSGLVVSGGGVAASGAGRVDSSPQQPPPEISTTTAFPDPEINTVGGSSEEPTPTPTPTPTTAEPEQTSTTTTTTTTTAPLPISPAASEPAGASAPPPPPQPPKRRTGGRSKQTPQPQPQPQDDDEQGYGNPTINAWFPFVFGGGGGMNPNRAFDAEDETRLAPNSYNSRPQRGRNAASSGHSPVAIANSFSTGRNAMAHSVATAYGSPPPSSVSQQRN